MRRRGEPPQAQGSSGPFKDHFSGAAAAYALRRPSYPPQLAASLAAACRARICAWDAGCGNGQLSVLLAAEFRQVIATDASREQIDRAVPDPRVRYVVARAEDGPDLTGIADASVDLCVAAQAAHWFHIDGYLAQVRRSAKQGAVVALVSYGILSVANAAVHEVIRDFYFDELSPHWPPERRHVEDGYASLPFPFEPVELPRMAIVRHWQLEALLGYLRTWSAIGAMRAAGREARVLAFEHAVSSAWGSPDLQHEVSFPLTVRAGRIG